MHNLNNILKGRRLCLPAALLLFVAIGCRQSEKLPEEMVAQVNNSYLVSEQLEYGIPQGLDEDVILTLKKSMISNWVDNETLYQAALQEGFKHGAQEEFFLDQYSKSLLIQRYLNSKLDKEYNISRQDIEEYYQKNTQEFIRQFEEVHIVHVLLPHKDNAIFDEIDKTDDLLTLIKKYYFDEKSTKELPNGDLGYVAVESLPDIFVRTLKRMKTGSVSRSIKTGQGYHFLQLLDWQKSGSLRDLELVKNQITVRLKQERREDEQDRLLKASKANAQIQTYLSKIQG